MQLDLIALAEDTASARAQLSNAHCRPAVDPELALLALASQLLLQARVVLEAVYGDPELAREHGRMLFSG
jgi:hypothetical protein